MSFGLFEDLRGRGWVLFWLLGCFVVFCCRSGVRCDGEGGGGVLSSFSARDTK